MTGVICGTGSYLPETILENSRIAKMVDTDAAWIEERTGIVRRRIIKEETTVTMAAEAGRRALEDAGMKPEDVDLILLSSASCNVVTPCGACEVQRILGANRAVCFDMNAACSGFLFAYQTALAYIQSGMCQTALIIGSESLSNLVDWTDRGTCILFGDGAGAAVLRAKEGAAYRPAAHSDGIQGDVLTCTSRHVKHPVPEDSYLRMDGRSIFKFAVKKVPEVIEEVLKSNGIGRETIDYFIVHQANKRIIEAAARRMGEPIEKFPMNLQEYGNTSSASIPILLDELHRNGTLKAGQRLVLSGFGAGLSWGAAVIDWELPGKAEE